MRSKNTERLMHIGELAAIERICRRLPVAKDVLCAAGDDCAVVRPAGNASEDLVLTSDAVIEKTHFSPETDPALVGRKAISRVLSDIASMGAEPRWALIDLVAPPSTPVKTIERIYSGATAAARKHGLSIAGGDTASGPLIELHVFAIGSTPRDSAVLRSGAKRGDAVFVTGSLGGSIKGKHLSFQPRLAEGRFLRNWATSMIDVSDGLASDLAHLNSMSGTGAILEQENIPVSRNVEGGRNTKKAVEHALYDGEDFELLFTIPGRKVEAFTKAWKKSFTLQCSMIGCITSKRGLIEITEKNGTVRILEKTGYQHFKK